MALQTSGPISLNDINIELPNKNSGDFISMNDNYVRDLIGKIAGTTMSLSEWYGASATEIQTVTVGFQSAPYVQWYGYGSDEMGTNNVGWGSIDDGTSGLYNNATIAALAVLNGYTTVFYVNGNHANSGWTSMKIGNGTPLLRSAASFNYVTEADRSQWTWSNTGNDFGTTTGVDVDVVFA